MSPPKPPFSRPIAVLSVPRAGQNVVLRPTEAQRAAIAAFLALPAVECFEAEVTVAPSRGGSFHVTGGVKARVQQVCVVSLEPFPAEIDETIDVRFAPEEQLGSLGKKEVERTLEDEDPPEPVINGVIDLGELAVEALALGLHPFPRKPGVETPAMGDADEPRSPFAALAALKKPQAG
jgi:uncharacterized metal-binding protein YceD (DUF177 family)